MTRFLSRSSIWSSTAARTPNCIWQVDAIDICLLHKQNGNKSVLK
jgi:hypothetical protein